MRGQQPKREVWMSKINLKHLNANIDNISSACLVYLLLNSHERFENCGRFGLVRPPTTS